MGKRTVLDARVTDVEKRRYPSKHYVYIITVTWSDSAVNTIYRRYSKFFDFQMKLFALFPEEAGARNPSQRMIPFLPEKIIRDISLPEQLPDELQQTIQQGIQKGKKLFGRSHTREVALRRLGPLDEYCRQLVRLPPKLSDCDEVINFFTPTDEDINPPQEDESRRKKEKGDIEQISDPIQSEQYTVIADYKKQQKNEVDLHAGDIVDVFEKGENGWWFVSVNDSQGWAPGTFLATGDGKDEEETLTPCDEPYITNNQYQATQEDEVSFQKGVVVKVVMKSLDGWWKVQYQEKEGWVPATYLQKYHGPNTASTVNQAIEIIGNVMNISDLESRRTRPLPIKPSGISGTSDDRQNLARAVGGTDVKPTPPRRTTVRRSSKSRHRYSYSDSNLDEGERTALKRLESSEKKRYTYSGTNIGEVQKTVRRGATRNRVRRQTEYFTIADFAGSSTDDSITFVSGQKVQVAQQTDSGWWFVKIGEEEGWAPSTFIEARHLKPDNNSPINSGGLRISNTSIGSVDEETGEKKPKTNKPQIGSSDGAFRPVSPHSKRPLPSIPSVDNATPESVSSPGQRKDKPARPPVASKPKVDNSKPGISALKQQLEQQLAMRDTGDAPPPPVPRKISSETAPPPPVPRKISSETAPPPPAARKISSESAPPPPPPPAKRTSEQWITVARYDKENDTEIGFREGTRVQIVEKDESGWWLIRIGAEEGWAPSTFLQKA